MLHFQFDAHRVYYRKLHRNNSIARQMLNTVDAHIIVGSKGLCAEWSSICPRFQPILK